MNTYLVAWTISPENHEAAGTAFLEGGAPMPDGLTMIGRWHQPGSHRGWLVCEGSHAALAEHLHTWGRLLDFDVTPVVPDEVTGEAMQKVYG